MRKKLFLGVVAAMALASAAGALIGCSGGGNHSSGEEVQEGHRWHDYYTYDEAYHWIDCDHCEETLDFGEHEYRGGYCEICGAEEPRTHDFYEFILPIDDEYHGRPCMEEGCMEIADLARHNFVDGVCIDCGLFAPPPPHEHTYDTSKYVYDENEHWYAASCEHKSERSEVGSHTYEGDVCTVCGFDRSVSMGLEFVLNEDRQSYKLRSMGQCTDTDVIVPSVYNGLPVTSVWGGFKLYCGNITSIYLPESVKTIESSAFFGVKTLTTVTTFAELIDSNAFNGCSALENVYLTGTVSIGRYTFYECSSIKTLVIPDTLQEVESDSFEHCAIENITAPIVGLFSRSMLSTTNDVTVTVTKIDRSGGIGSGKIVSVTFPDDIEEFPSGFMLLGQSYLKNVHLPANLKVLPSLFFGNNTAIETVELPEGITEIGNYVFSDCTSLTEIELPAGVTAIGEYAFYNCESLKTINIPQGVTEIADSTFEGCTSLTDIEFPSQLKSIGAKAFYNCSTFTEIDIPDGVESIGEMAFSGCSSVVRLIVPDSVTEVGSRALGVSPEYISAPAFCMTSSSKLKTAVITSGEVLPNTTFYNATALESVTLPQTLTEIGEYGFYNCISLTRIDLPASLQTVGYFAFQGCTNLQGVYITDMAAWLKIDFAYIEYASNNTPLSIAKNLYLNNELVTSVTVPEEITEIKDCAFWGCASLESIKLHNQITRIGTAAFAMCTSLRSIDVPASVSVLGSQSFGGCSSLTTVKFDNSRLTVQEVSGSEVFYGCVAIETAKVPSVLVSYVRVASKALSTLIVIGGELREDNLKSGINLVIFEDVTIISTSSSSTVAVQRVYYRGTPEEWAELTDGIAAFQSTEVYYYREVRPADTANNYWHFAGDGLTVVVW